MTPKTTSIGILGLGVFLPPEVRRNDWWPADVVARWMEGRRTAPTRPGAPEPLTEGKRRVLDALFKQSGDPFLSAVERRVMPDGMTVHDMEEQAARAAIGRAGLALHEIDLLLTQTVTPDFLMGNPACILHERLGLPRSCFSMHTDVSSSAFAMQLILAEAMIRAGRARYALLVQSCMPSRLVDMGDPIAPLFGDIATAAVVGPVSSGRGIEAAVSYSDGRAPRTLVMSVPGRAWYDEGRAVLHVADAHQSHAVFLETADNFKQSVDAALAAADRSPGEIDFFCVHQGTPWMLSVVQDYVGMSAARSMDGFAATGYVFGSTIPVTLALAQDRKLLGEDDRVVLAFGGPGATYGAVVLRWGT
jgi:3-oxoacyl-[acyl-carrier-protein] synthase III